MTDADMKRLQSHEMHGATDTTPGVEVRAEPITNGTWLEYISPDGNICMEGWIFANPSEAIITDHEIEMTFTRAELDAWIAILQRAKAAMKGGA